jgi:hypothetical protein
VSCPNDCVYLGSGSDYQQKRLGEQFMPVRHDFYRDLEEFGGNKAVGLLNLIEAVTFSYFEGRRDGQDAEIVAALQSLRRTLSPLHMPSAPMSVFAEYLTNEHETFKKQNPEQLPESTIGLEVLDRIIRFVSAFSGKDLQSRRFLGGLVGYVKTYYPQLAELLQKKRERGRIMLPGQFFMPPTPETHVHGPDCGHHHA